MAAAALLHTFRNLAGIELAPLAAGETFAGGALPFTLALAGGADARMRSRWPPAARRAVTVDVVPDAALPVTLELPTPQRGTRRARTRHVVVGFPAGPLARLGLRPLPAGGCRVPRAGSRTRRRCPPDCSGARCARRNRATSDADLAGLREYQPGDPLQRVAWKAVARGAGWYTKQFEGGGGGGPAMLAWRSLPRALDVEAQIARLTAWVLAAERVGASVCASRPGIALPAGQGREHRRAALTALALLPASAT